MSVLFFLNYDRGSRIANAESFTLAEISTNTTNNKNKSYNNKSYNEKNNKYNYE